MQLEYFFLECRQKCCLLEKFINAEIPGESFHNCTVFTRLTDNLTAVTIKVRKNCMKLVSVMFPRRRNWKITEYNQGFQTTVVERKTQDRVKFC